MEILLLLSVGLVAGGLGGLLGIGGSVIMIPAMVMFLGWDFHLAQAIAMTVNPTVALSSAIKHQRNKNISWQSAKYVLPIAVVCICIAAWLSNAIPSGWLKLSFGLFLIWVLWDQISCLTGRTAPIIKDSKQTPIRGAITGSITGTTAGLLGIGGGLIQVPLLNRLCGLNIKRAIGTSSAIMFITAICGAIVKDISLPVDTQGLHELFTRAAWLVPGAIVGGWFGAVLTNILSVTYIRIVFAILVLFAAYEMIVSGGGSIF
ncbi:MAG TPA: sulfite exporter TauE/SafE family protein [Phycisphaerales bacterium]|nr:sulfite exporter TauE/SafE family protein [Phycisphaerales bacterium]